MKIDAEQVAREKYLLELSHAVHRKGFKIFLPPEKIEASDEYGHGDPYEVELETPFQIRRINCTIRLARRALAECAQRPKILDIGCGLGHLTAALSREFPNAELSGLDYSISAIDSAIDLYPEIDFAVGDAHHLPYGADYFDLVLCNNIWEHVPDPLRMLQSIRKVLRPGGFVIISTPSRYRFENIIRLLRGKTVEFNSTLHVTEYSVGQVIEQLRFGEFEVLSHYSESMPIKYVSLRQMVVYGVGLRLLRKAYALYGRQHDLEGTVFFLATKS
jgi:ubiquinone/menaquinone biosynthesis C-methylase UbiE